MVQDDCERGLYPGRSCPCRGSGTPPDEIIPHRRTVELDTGNGLAVLDVCRTLGTTEQPYYRGKKESGVLTVRLPAKSVSVLRLQ